MRRYKGGGGTPAKQEVFSTKLPAFAQPYFDRLLQRSESSSLQQYTPYGGIRLADFGPDEALSQAMTRGFGTAGTPDQFTQASDSLGEIAATRPNINPYERLSFEDGINQFMNPYQQNVIDIAKREAMRGSAIQGDQIASKAAQSGGLGGYREAILQSERERNLGQRLDDIQAKGQDRAFNMAMQQLARERQVGLQEEQLRQAGDRVGIQGSRSLADIGSLIQQDALNRIGALGRIGEQERAMRQAGLDIGYDDFARQRDFDRDQIGFFSNVLQGIPIKSDQTVSTFQRQPGLLSQATGAGLTGLGIYRALQPGAGGQPS